MTRKTASFPLKMQAVETDGDAGVFEALVSVFGNTDLVGDKVVKGAFAKSLDRWAEKGDPIPVIWSHQWDDPNAHIGEVIEAEERDEGLWVKAQLDLDAPLARQVYSLLKRRRVTEMSFAYDVVEERPKDGANELVELEIIEVGPTLKGANPDTQLLAVKNADMILGSATINTTATTGHLTVNISGPSSEAAKATVIITDALNAAEVKAGRVLSAKNESKIREAVQMLSDVLASVSSGDDSEAGKAQTPTGEAETTSTAAATVRLLTDRLKGAV